MSDANTAVTPEGVPVPNKIVIGTDNSPASKKRRLDAKIAEVEADPQQKVVSRPDAPGVWVEAEAVGGLKTFTRIA